MGVCPIAPRVMEPAAQQEFAQAVATPLQIFPGIIACAAQVADGFFLRGRRPHFGQQPRAKQLREFPCIATISLNALPRFRGMSAGAITWQVMRVVASWRCKA